MAVKYWTAQAALYKFTFDGDGTTTHSPIVGETINVDGEEGDETAIVHSWTLSGGSWAGNDAAGTMYVYSASATFIANLADNDLIEDSGGTAICRSTTAVTLVTGNWQEAGNWGEGEDPAVPVDDDEVIFDSRSVISVTDGISILETGGDTFDLMHVRAGYTGDIGTTGERFHNNADKIIFEGTGTMWLICSAGDQALETDSDIDLVICNSDGGTLKLGSDVNSSIFTAQLTEVWAISGNVDILDDTNVDTLRLTPQRQGDLTVTIGINCEDDKANTEMDIFMATGTLTTDSKTGVLEQHDGTINYGTDLGASPETDMDITTMRIFGGIFNWNPDDSGNDAYIGDLSIYGGTVDASATLNNDRDKVLGNGAGNDIYLFDGGTLNVANDKGNILIAGSSQLWNFGGTLITDTYSEIGISYNQP